MQELYDVIVVGGGPSGLSAAIYMARAKYHVLVLEKEKFGGQITITSEIVNYPGVERASGTELTKAMRIQAEEFGAEFLLDEVEAIECTQDIKIIKTKKREYKTLGIILAVGASPRKIGFPGEKEFQGRGVAYCATCDGEFFTDMDIFVIGGGFAAAEEAIFLTRYARKVTIMVREEEFSCAQTIVDEVLQNPGIEVHYNTEIKEAGGENMLSYAVFVNTKTKEEIHYKAEEGNTFGIFVFAGYEPNTKWLKEQVELSKEGYIITDTNQKTNIDGVYAVGDVCMKQLRQVVTAVSDGAVAATSLEKYIAGIHEKLGIERAKTKDTKENQTEKKQKQEEFYKNSNFEKTNHLETYNDLQKNNELEMDSNKEKFEKNKTFLDKKMTEQLYKVFEGFEKTVIVKGYYDESPLSLEMEQFIEEIAEISEKIKYQKENTNANELKGIEVPAFMLCKENGEETGIAFHGVPSGHEINSFIIALYNIAGPGTVIEKEMEEKIYHLPAHNIKIMVSLSCTMCPEVVMSAQKIAAISEKITAHMYDLAHFTKYKKEYNIMSVPCMIIDEKQIVFGKKSLEELVHVLKK